MVWLLKRLASLKQLDDGQIPKKKKKKRLSVNFIPAVFCLLDFLTFEDGDDRLSRNVGNELSVFAA